MPQWLLLPLPLLLLLLVPLPRAPLQLRWSQLLLLLLLPPWCHLARYSHLAPCRAQLAVPGKRDHRDCGHGTPARCQAPPDAAPGQQQHAEGSTGEAGGKHVDARISLARSVGARLHAPLRVANQPRLHKMGQVQKQRVVAH